MNTKKIIYKTYTNNGGGGREFEGVILDKVRVDNTDYYMVVNEANQIFKVHPDNITNLKN